MKAKNPDTYRARFAQLRIDAWGKEQMLDMTLDVEIYQARVLPELWLPRLPAFKPLENEWRAGSAEALMQHIATYFGECIEPWELVPCPDLRTPAEIAEASNLIEQNHADARALANSHRRAKRQGESL